MHQNLTQKRPFGVKIAFSAHINRFYEHLRNAFIHKKLQFEWFSTALLIAKILHGYVQQVDLFWVATPATSLVTVA